MAGIDITQVPYRGAGPALTDLIGGQVQLMFVGAAPSIEYIRAGKLRPLAVTSATGWQALPAVPTIGDFVPGYEAIQWFGVVAPRNTPADIVEKLNKEINAALGEPGLKARLAEQGGTVSAGSPADFGKYIADETAKWGKVNRAGSLGVFITAPALNWQLSGCVHTRARPHKQSCELVGLGWHMGAPRCFCIDAVNLEHRLRNIEADRANLAHGWLPSMCLRSTQSLYGTSMPRSGCRPPHQIRKGTH